MAASGNSNARLVALLIVGILFLAGVGLYGVHATHVQGDRAIGEAMESARLLDAAREAQVGFKIQVQHWKNLLLRGHDPDDLTSYRERFAEEEASVSRRLAELAGESLLDPGIREEVRSIEAEHERLGQAYRAALEKLDATRAESIFAVDRAVRGIDQELTNRIDSIAGRILTAEKEHVAVLKTVNEARYSRLQTFVSVVTLGVIVLMGIVLWRMR